MTATADLLLVDARIILPHGEELNGWLSVVDGKVHDAGEGSSPIAHETLDCRGMEVLPGLVDIHVHFRDPDQQQKEDFITGSAAAAFGGVTTVVDMPNDEQPTTRPADIVNKANYLDGRSYVDFGLHAQLGDSAHVMDEMCELGVAGFKWLLGYERPDDPDRVTRAALKAAVEKAADADALIGVHAEAAEWIADLTEDLVSKERTDPFAHGESRPPFVEALGIAEAATLGWQFGCRMHIHHLSSAAGLELATFARTYLEARLTIETCPHYLLLNEKDVERLGTIARVNPPIRRREDNEALWRGICGGQIDCIASDHAPHLIAEKRTPDIWSARPGLLGVETLFPLLYAEVRRGRLSLSRFVEVTAERPAEIVGFQSKGRLLPGFDADLIVVDPVGPNQIHSASLHSKTKLTVYEGWVGEGRLVHVYLRGRPVVHEGRLVGERVGRFVRSARSRVLTAQ